ncbi:MAG: Re/Si-specific NAD(P)(+) transhydrogenase subunit alpha [Chloroflexi bacterium]|nr:Re/Si-specific NAD(P)(+) transhydrogenase subunit alpha [Chloroflexota bacterium]
MKVGVPKEIVTGERRVALVPDSVGRLLKAGFAVLVEAGAGEGAFYADRQYEDAGARIVTGAADLFGQADIVLKVQKPTVNDALGAHEVELMPEGATLITFIQPLLNPDLVRLLAKRRITSFSMDAIPRIARAQAMDALSSQSAVAGYKAVLIAANALGKFFPMMMTAAGTIAPTKVLVMGTGVAGLQAIATARRLGAVVQGYDIRPATKEQVESLGATFISPQLAEQTETTGGYAQQLAEDAQERERALVQRVVKGVDIVVTTALIPGRRAPVLVTAPMVQEMQPGSVIVDIAAEMGGNCELTEPGTVVVRHGVTIHGPLNLPSAMPVHASQMYARNISNMLLHLTREGQLHLDFEDSITGACCITHNGQVLHEASRALVSASTPDA